MSTADHATVVRRMFEEGVNQRNLAVFDQVLAPSYTNHNFPAPAPGPEGFKQVMGMFFQAFPDIHETTEATVAEGEMVAARGHFAGTHQGDFMGIPATGKSIQVSYIAMYRLEAGKVVENWVQMDLLGLMQQLGAIPTPGQAGASTA